jgi:uncharacterized protein (DUF427 family)
VAAIPDWARERRGHWRYDGDERPGFALAPAGGQESVWDYPRPPAVVPDEREVTVSLRGHEIARTKRAVRVLETASPPTFYLPPEDVRAGALVPAPGVSRCEWKGQARYWTVALGAERLERVAWSYPEPFPGFEPIRDWLAFYPTRLACFVGGERVRPQPGGLYGGWVTSELVGPWKGEPGTESW